MESFYSWILVFLAEPVQDIHQWFVPIHKWIHTVHGSSHCMCLAAAWCLGETAARETIVHGQGVGEIRVSSDRSPWMDNWKTMTDVYIMEDSHPLDCAPG